jgi:hypothetical protein
MVIEITERGRGFCIDAFILKVGEATSLPLPLSYSAARVCAFSSSLAWGSGCITTIYAISHSVYEPIVIHILNADRPSIGAGLS